MKPPLSRRSFLRGGSAVAAVPFVSRAAGAGSPLRSDALKVGLIGCGGRGTGAALQALKADEGTVLWALADAFEDKLVACRDQLTKAMGDAAERCQVPPERSFVGLDAFERLIARDVDVVLLATPPYFRPQHLAAALAAKKHVFCEKPVAVDAPGIRSVMESIELAKREKLGLVSGFCWRYRLSHRETWKRILDGSIGTVRTVYTNYNTSQLGTVARQEGQSELEWHLRNWKHVLWLCGDHLVEQAVHSLDKQAWSFGDEPPIACTAVGGRIARSGPDSGNIYDHFGLTYDYAGGAKAFHMARQINGCTDDNSDFVWGTRGHVSVNGWAGRYQIEGEEPWVYEGPSNDMYQQEHDELFAAIRAGEPFVDDWMAKSTLLAIMGRMAAYTGQTITWEQALGSQERLGPETTEWGPCAIREVAIPGKTRFV